MRVVSKGSPLFNLLHSVIADLIHLFAAFYSYFDNTPLMVFGALNLIFALVALFGLGALFLVWKAILISTVGTHISYSCFPYLPSSWRIDPGTSATSHMLFGLPSLSYWLTSLSMLFCSSSTVLAITQPALATLPIEWVDLFRRPFLTERRSTWTLQPTLTFTTVTRCGKMSSNSVSWVLL